MQDHPALVAQALISRFVGRDVLVLGDVMLDEYLSGRVERISPEAPVPVVKIEDSFERLGGAANVAHCLAALGAKVRLCGVVGADDAAERLRKEATRAGIDSAGVFTVAGRSTTRKLRVLAKHQQVLRLDWEKTEALVPSPTALLDYLARAKKPEVVIVSDYAKGLLTPETLAHCFAVFSGWGVPVLTDPKQRDFAVYRGSAYLAPNFKEFQDAAGTTIAMSDVPAMRAAALGLLAKTGATGLIVTLGEGGMFVVAPDRAELLPTTTKEVFDVTGAGDTVMAVLALALGAGADAFLAARLANAAAGVVVGKLGTAVLSVDELAHAVLPASNQKQLSWAELSLRVQRWRSEGKSIVFANGCFDLLHVGHLNLLHQAASQGDVLVVGLNSDASIKRNKGESRPILPEAERASLLSALECVDAVTIFGEDTPLELLQMVRPNVLVKGSDYRLDQVVGRELVEGDGGKVVLVPIVADRSTSSMLERIRSVT